MRLDNLSSLTKSTAAGFQNTKYFPTSTPMRMPSLSSTFSWKMKAGNETSLCRSRSSHLQKNLNSALICQGKIMRELHRGAGTGNLSHGRDEHRQGEGLVRRVTNGRAEPDRDDD